MNKSTKLIADVATITLCFSGMLFCALTHFWFLVFINGLCFSWAVGEVLEVADLLDEED